MSSHPPSVTHWRIAIGPRIYRAACDSRISLSTTRNRNLVDCAKCRHILRLAPIKKRKPHRRIGGVRLNELGLTNREALAMLATMGYPRQVQR